MSPLALALSLRAEVPPSQPEQSLFSLEKRVRQYQVLLLMSGLAWFACEIGAWHGLSYSPLRLAYVALRADLGSLTALGCGFVLFLCARPRDGELMMVLATAAVVTLVLHCLHLIGVLEDVYDPVPPVVTHAVAGLGVASLIYLARQTQIRSGADRVRTLSLLLLGLLLPLFCPLKLYVLAASIPLQPITLDAEVYAADASLGLQLSFAAAQLLTALPLLRLLALFVYHTLPLAFLVVLLAQSYAPRLPAGSIFWSFQVVAVCGLAVYLIFPVVGPAWAFAADYPATEPEVDSVLAAPPPAPYAPRNGMPSLHLSWTLMLWWHARSLSRWVRTLTGFYLAVTVLATLGLGFHYAWDLIVAVPFALAIRAGFRHWRRCAFGAVLAVLCLLLICHGRPLLDLSPLLTSAGVLVLIGFCLLQERALSRPREVVETAAVRQLSGWSLPRMRAGHMAGAWGLPRSDGRVSGCIG